MASVAWVRVLLVVTQAGVCLSAAGSGLIQSSNQRTGGVATEPSAKSFDCTTTFRTDDDVELLTRRFGATAVTVGNVYLGEGEYEPGTVLFAGSEDDKVEILWKDVAARRHPRVVRTRGDRSKWSTPDGVTLGLELTKLEAINRRPFRLAGFAWDYGGTQTSWAGGQLGRAGDCSVRVRLRAKESPGTEQWYRQLEGAREFSSGHPAMQNLNPRVYEVWLDFRESH